MTADTKLCQTDANKQPMDNWLLAAPVGYLVVLGLTLWFFRQYGHLNILGFTVPLSVLWFGTLGGVIASLQGIFFHNRKWDDSFTHWHIFSGVVGAAFGLASYLFLVVIVNSATGAGAASGSTATNSQAVYALGAFAIGYGQSHFHAMMDRVFSVIFQPPKITPQSSANAGAVNPEAPAQATDSDGQAQVAAPLSTQ